MKRFVKRRKLNMSTTTMIRNEIKDYETQMKEFNDFLRANMDIIKHGDFSITNINNKTTFSFRIPSTKEIDYVKESRESNT